MSLEAAKREDKERKQLAVRYKKEKKFGEEGSSKEEGQNGGESALFLNTPEMEDAEKKCANLLQKLELREELIAIDHFVGNGQKEEKESGISMRREGEGKYRSAEKTKEMREGDVCEGKREIVIKFDEISRNLKERVKKQEEHGQKDEEVDSSAGHDLVRQKCREECEEQHRAFGETLIDSSIYLEGEEAAVEFGKRRKDRGEEDDKSGLVLLKENIAGEHCAQPILLQQADEEEESNESLAAEQQKEEKKENGQQKWQRSASSYCSHRAPSSQIQQLNGYTAHQSQRGRPQSRGRYGVKPFMSPQHRQTSAVSASQSYPAISTYTYNHSFPANSASRLDLSVRGEPRIHRKKLEPAPIFGPRLRVKAW